MDREAVSPVEARYDEYVISDSAGVPVVHPAQALGDPIAIVSFRVGLADEAIPDRGLTHLAEHRALQPYLQTAESWDDTTQAFANGTTGSTITRFTCTGTRAGIEEFVGRLSDEIAQLAEGVDEGELHLEARILGAESRLRDGSAWANLYSDLYGASRLGMAAISEAALFDLDPERLRAWVARNFARQNCAVALTFPPSGDLGLGALPSGTWQEPPDFLPNHHQLPAYRPRPGPVMFAAPVRRRIGNGTLAAILRRSLMQRLRSEDGVSYAPSASYDPLSREWALISGMFDVADEDARGRSRPSPNCSID
ncbi:MAG: hypothetical protein U9O18_06175 [Chloroflexota bacterium]|nr:hypothetical protein [Chloroflexota bacterium]